MIDMIFRHVIRSICIIIIGAACNFIIIYYDVTRHGKLTGEAAAGVAAVLCVSAVCFLNQDRLDRFLILRRFRRKGGAR